jgi:hypothetical protein
MAEGAERESIYVTQTKTTSGLGIAALVLGLIACLGCWIPFIGLLSIPFAAFGIFFGGLGIIVGALTKRSYIGLPVAGTLVSLTAVVVAAVITSSVGTKIEEIRSEALNIDVGKPNATFVEGETEAGIQSSPVKSTGEMKAEKERQEKEDYIANHIELDYRVKIYKEGEENQHPGVVFRLCNKGDRTLSRIAVTVYLRNKEGQTVHEATFRPMGYDQLPPGYVWDKMWREGAYTYYSLGEPDIRKAEYIPSEWQPGPNAAYAKITDIEFATTK